MENCFYIGTVLHHFLFESVDITSGLCFAGLCVAVALVSVCSEGLRVARCHLARTVPPAPRPLVVLPDNVITGAGGPAVAGERVGVRDGSSVVQALLDQAETGGGTQCDCRPCHLLFQSLVHVVHVTIGYLLMLTVMTFNTYLFVSVILGTTVGYFLFGTFDALLSSRRSPYLEREAVGGMSRLVRTAPSSAATAINVLDDVGGAACSSSSVQVLEDGGSVAGIGGAGVASSASAAAYDGADGGRALVLEEGAAEHRTSDTVGLLSEEVTVDVHA